MGNNTKYNHAGNNNTKHNTDITTPIRFKKYYAHCTRVSNINTSCPVQTNPFWFQQVHQGAYYLGCQYIQTRCRKKKKKKDSPIKSHTLYCRIQIIYLSHVISQGKRKAQIYSVTHGPSLTDSSQWKLMLCLHVLRGFRHVIVMLKLDFQVEVITQAAARYLDWAHTALTLQPELQN